MNARVARILEAAKAVAILEERLAHSRREFHRLLGEDEQGQPLPPRTWTYRPGIVGRPPSPVRDEVLAALSDKNLPMSVSEVAALVPGTDHDTVNTTLCKLARLGRVQRVAHGVYWLPASATESGAHLKPGGGS